MLLIYYPKEEEIICIILLQTYIIKTLMLNYKK